MSNLPVYGERPCILLTNDDGPPCPSSPNIFGFCKLLQQRLGWDVKVVIPDCQKSWVGKAYAISEIISVSYFYPLEPDGLKGETCSHPRPLKDGETMEWVLLSGTPATCANIALHNLYPGEIDMVISGPNHGRNCSTAFALSSGTLGAALAAALSVPIPGPSSSPSLHERHIPALALSYGVVDRPVPEETIELAHDVSVELVKRLWDNWGYEDERGTPVQVYSINVPLIGDKLRADKRKIYWTSMRRNSYGQLFKPTKLDPNLNWWRRKHPPSPTDRTDVSSAGPGALPAAESSEQSEASTSQEQRQFHFAPSMAPLLSPTKDELPYGTDAWAFAEGYIGITPLRAEFAGLTDLPGGIASYAGKEWT